MTEQTILISACLMGIECRYDGTGKAVPELQKILEGYQVVTVCPETLGGLVAPRPPAEIQGGAGPEVLAGTAGVFNREGRECTAEFIRGAEAVLQLVRQYQPLLVILKAKSPSCGVGAIYDGSFSGRLQPGDGVTAALLKRNGVKVYSETEFLERLLQKLEKNNS
ncbi:MAG TPA: DUF523 domain-containing protein [Bacillota bacterium]|nr:DUF523 domain-containing protein [Bacillota bacterium]